MYILINKLPFKVFDMKVSDIQQLNDVDVMHLVHAGLNEHRFPWHEYNRDEIIAMREQYVNSKLKPEKITDEEYQMLYVGSRWREQPGLVLVQISDYTIDTIYKVSYNPETYWFSVRDGERIQYSKLYSSKEEAERARNRVLHRANALISKLLRVEI